MHDPDFLRAIIENPYDDGLRLVYADWLEEHGHRERADFIRYQIAVFDLDRNDPRRMEQGNRYKVSDFAYSSGSPISQEWYAELPQLPEKIGWSTWRRGFADTIVLGGKCDYHSLEDSVFEHIPFVRLELNNWDRDQNLRGTTLLSKTRELCFFRDQEYDWVNSRPVKPHEMYQSIAEILSWTELHSLQELHLKDFAGMIDNFSPIIRTPFTQLKKFRYEKLAWISPLSMEIPTFDTAWLSNLTHLSLTNLSLSPLHFEQIAYRLNLGKITHLTLYNCGLDDDSFERFLTPSVFQNLKFLNLEGNRLTEKFLPRLLDLLPSECRLVIGDNPLNQNAFSLFVQSPHLDRLNQIPVGVSLAISANDASILQQSNHAATLSVLHIRSTQSESVDWPSVLDTERFPSLRNLHFSGARFPKLPPLNFPNLLSLQFRDCVIENMEDFVTTSVLPKLGSLSFLQSQGNLNYLNRLSVTFEKLGGLDFEGTQISDDELISFFASKPFKILSGISLKNCQISDQVLEAIPNSRILESCPSIFIMEPDYQFEDRAFSIQTYLNTVVLCEERKIKIDDWSLLGTPDADRVILRTIPNSNDPLDFTTRNLLFPWLNTALSMSDSCRDLYFYPISYFGELNDFYDEPTESITFDLENCRARLRQFLYENPNDEERECLRIRQSFEEFQLLDRSSFVHHFSEILPVGTLESGPLIEWLRPRYSNEADPNELFSRTIGTPNETIPAHQFRDVVMNRMFPHENTVFFGASLGDNEQRVLLIFDEHFTGFIRGSKYTPLSNT